MLASLRPQLSRSGDAVLDAGDALRTLEGLGHKHPILLLVHPRTQTPFYRLLYARALASGIAPVMVRSLDEALAVVPLARIGEARLVLHLHWLAGVFGHDGADEARARERTAAFIAQLDRLREQSVRIAWTVHNPIPEDTRLARVQVELARAVIARSSAIHVMAAATEDIMRPDVPLPPDRIIRVPHPAMRGLYPDLMDRDQARHQLRLLPDQPAVGLFGALRPHKGLDELLDELPALSSRRPGVRLVVAGRPGREPEIQATIDRAVANPSVLADPRRVPDDHVQVIMRGVDAIVVPYRRVLNSAAVMTAIEYAQPLVLPDDPALAEFADPSLSVIFQRGVPGSLAAAIDRALDLPRPGVLEASRRISAARDPADLSRAFAAALRELVERETSES